MSDDIGTHGDDDTQRIEAVRPAPPKHGFFRRVGKPVLVVLAVGIVGFLALFGIAYTTIGIPDGAQAQAVAQGSTFYYNDGKTVLAYEGVDRKPVTLDRVPQHVRDAVLAAEDHDFYTQPGVSLKGTARALWSTLSGRQVQGGSTITQQMVRNYYEGLSQERSVTRKLKEIIVALKVDREKSKDWILEQYLNTIYYGRGAYGIQAAAKAYYNKDVGRLTPAEGAFLAAAIQRPSYFAEPYGDRRQVAEARWRSVVSTMGASGLTFPLPPRQRQTGDASGQRGFMIEQAKAELRQRGYTDEDISGGALKVTTTFDQNLMRAAENAVNGAQLSGRVQTGLAAVDPKTGEVVAFYGGREYLDRQFNNAFQGRPQSGSSFKSYVLAAALQAGYGLDATVDGSSPQTFAGSSVRNDSGAGYGEVDLVTATERSINTAYVNLGLEVGLDKVVAMAEKMGIPAAQLAAHKNAPTLSLGVASISPVQQASGYATFPAGGVHRQAHVIRQVVDRDGGKRVVADKGTRAFSKGVADDATYALEQVVEGGTGTRAQLYDGRPVAGKTGTTDKARAIWFTGFTPQLSTSVAMFDKDGKPLSGLGGYEAYGGQLPAEIWRSFMTEAMRGRPIESFAPPSYTGSRRDDNETTSPEPSAEPTRPSRPSQPPRPTPSAPASQAPEDPEENVPDPRD